MGEVKFFKLKMKKFEFPNVSHFTGYSKALGTHASVSFFEENPRHVSIRRG